MKWARLTCAKDARTISLQRSLPSKMPLGVVVYNFFRIHQTLWVTPAMAAGVTTTLWEMKDVVDMLEAWEAVRGRRAWFE
jgi:hypothetical protein